jgi:hypothetical protein
LLDGQIESLHLSQASRGRVEKFLNNVLATKLIVCGRCHSHGGGHGGGRRHWAFAHFSLQPFPTIHLSFAHSKQFVNRFKGEDGEPPCAHDPVAPPPEDLQPNQLIAFLRANTAQPVSFSAAIRDVDMSPQERAMVTNWAYQRTIITMDKQDIVLPMELNAAVYALRDVNAPTLRNGVNLLLSEATRHSASSRPFMPLCRLAMEAFLRLEVFNHRKAFLPMTDASQFLSTVKVGDLFVIDQIFASTVGTYADAVALAGAGGSVMVFLTSSSRVLASMRNIAELVVLPGSVFRLESTDVVDGVTRVRAIDVTKPQ